MLGFEDTLVNNLEKFKQIESQIIEEGYSEDDFFELLQKRVRSSTDLINENKDILENRLRPLLGNVGSLPQETVDSLLELSLRLYSFSNPLDMGISLEILEGVTEWARKHQDIDRLIKSLYHTGFAYQQLNDRLLRHGSAVSFSKCHDCFYEAASYAKDYFNIASKETRSYINRCLGNLYVISNSPTATEPDELSEGFKGFIEKVEAALDFWNNKKVREFDPDLPWDMYIINAHLNLGNWIWRISRQKHRLNDKLMIRRVCDSCKYLLEQEQSKVVTDLWPSGRTDFIKYASRYCLDEISYEEMLDNVRGMYHRANSNDYSADGLFSNLFTPMDLIRLFRAEDLSKASFKKEINQIIRRMYEYCKKFPAEGNKILFSGYVGSACKTMVEILDFDESVEFILSLTTYTHLPTYVHSMMVQEMSKIIASHIMSANPEYFIGMCGSSSIAEVIANKQEIIDLIGLAAFCHDVGKILYLDKVAIFSRKLYDLEFKIIKEHANADSLIKASGDKMQLIVDVITGHHKWYDNSRGYSEKFDPRSSDFKSTISIIIAADSIDAATDGIGRYYSKSLTLDAVLNEIHEQADSRYCPVVANALKDQALVATLQESITSGRKKAYHKAYLKLFSYKPPKAQSQSS